MPSRPNLVNDKITICTKPRKIYKVHLMKSISLGRIKKKAVLRAQHLFFVVALGTNSSNLPAKTKVLTTLWGQFIGTSLHTDVAFATSFHLFFGEASFIFLGQFGTQGGAVKAFALCLQNSCKMRPWALHVQDCIFSKRRKLTLLLEKYKFKQHDWKVKNEMQCSACTRHEQEAKKGWGFNGNLACQQAFLFVWREFLAGVNRRNMEWEKARGPSRRLVTRGFTARVLVTRSFATRVNKQEGSYQVHMGHPSYVVLGTAMVKVLCSDKKKYWICLSFLWMHCSIVVIGNSKG